MSTPMSRSELEQEWRRCRREARHHAETVILLADEIPFQHMTWWKRKLVANARGTLNRLAMKKPKRGQR